MDPAEFCLVNHLYGDVSPTLRFCKFCRKAMCEVCYDNHIKTFNNGCSIQAANGDTIVQIPRESSFSTQKDNMVPQDIYMEPAPSLSENPTSLINNKQVPGISSLSKQNENVVPQDINMEPVPSLSGNPSPLINNKQIPAPKDKHLFKQCIAHSLTMDQFCYPHCSVICRECRYEAHQDCSVKDVEQVCLELDHTTVGELRKSLNKIRVDAIEVKTILGRNISDLEKQKQSMMKKLKKAHEDVLKEVNRKYEETKSEIEGQNEKYTSELCAYICHINSILEGLDMCLKDTRPLEGRHMEVGVFLKYQDILSSNSQIPSDLQNLYNKIKKVKVSFKENKRFQPLMEKSAIGNINATTTKYNSISPHQEINCPLFVSQPVLIRKDNYIAGATTKNYTPLNPHQEINCPLFVSQPALIREDNSAAAIATTKSTSQKPHQEINCPSFVSQPALIREDNSAAATTTTKSTSQKPHQEINCSSFVSQPALVREDNSISMATTTNYTSQKSHQEINRPLFVSQPVVIRGDNTVAPWTSTSYTTLNSYEESLHCPLPISQPVLIREDNSVAAATSLCSSADPCESGCSVSNETYQYVKAVKDRDLDIICNDDEYCAIEGLDITQDGRLLMADFSNDKIKMLTADRQRLIYLQLNERCRDITVYNDTTAVTAGDHNIFFIDFSEGILIVKKKVRVDYYIYRIQVCGHNLLVTCWDYDVRSVKLITTAGKPLWSVSQDQTGDDLFLRPWYITCYRDQSQCRVVVTDCGENCITVLDGDTGDVIKVIPVKGKQPRGVTTDNNGNFYICYRGTKEIVIWNKDMTSSRLLFTTRQYPRALGYDSFRNQLIVSFSVSYKVECYQLE